MPLSNKEKILYFVLGMILAAFSTFLYFALGDNIIEAAKSLIDVNGALIGFFAVVLVFMLTSLQGEQRRITEDLRRTEKLHEEYLKKGFDDNSEFLDYKKKLAQMSYHQGYVTGFATVILQWSIGAVVLSIVSIMSGLLAMSKTEQFRIIGIYVSIFAMVMSIVVLFSLLMQYKNILTTNVTCRLS
jgi:hypothetical protein